MLSSNPRSSTRRARPSSLRSARTGHTGMSSVRQGKHFDLEVDDTVTDEDLERARRHAAGQPGHRDLDRDPSRHGEPAQPRPRRHCELARDPEGGRLVTLGTGGADRGSASSPFRARSMTSTPPARSCTATPRRSPLWHADADLRGVDAVVVPGGFSYGDYLRAGAIAAQAPVMRSVDRGRPRRNAGAGDLQRLPGAVRGRPVAGGAGAQRQPAVHLSRPVAAGREHRRPPGHPGSSRGRKSWSR